MEIEESANDLAVGLVRVGDKVERLTHTQRIEQQDHLVHQRSLVTIGEDDAFVGTGAYWQISYTRNMKGRSEYIRREWVTEIRKQIATHKRFRRWIDQWVDLGIEHSKLTMQVAKTKGKK